jgi:hypothetical protein
MIKAIRGVILTIMVIACWQSIAFATPAPAAEDILKQFLKLDYDGAGLSTDGNGKIHPLTTWEDGPGWDACIVVTGYKIGEPRNSGMDVIIPVTYEVLGMVSGGVEWIPLSKKNRSNTFGDQVDVDYVLAKIDGGWKIKGPQIYPHVSLDVALEMHERNLADIPADMKIQKDKENILAILRKLKGTNK